MYICENNHRKKFLKDEVLRNKVQGSIPKPAISRLCLIYRFLDEMIQSGVQQISSSQIAERLSMNSHNVRKDIGYLGDVGNLGAGYDVINPVQTNSAEMDPETLKQEFGKDICFWGGGADTRAVLNNAAPEEVRKHVRERLEIFSPGGGFVFNPVHNIMPDVPPENIVAMFDEIYVFNNNGRL